MIVFQLKRDVARYLWLTFSHEDDFFVLGELDGRAVAPSWRPRAVRWPGRGNAPRQVRGDFLTLGAAPVFSERAVDALLDLLVPAGELLPLACRDGRYYLYNVTQVLDALDERRSELRRFQTCGLLRVVRPEFRPEALRGAMVFKVPQLRGAVYVTSLFVRRVAEAGLTGFKFPPLWTADAVG